MSALDHYIGFQPKVINKIFFQGQNLMHNWVDMGKNVGSKISVVTILEKSLEGDRDPNIVKWVTN